MLLEQKTISKHCVGAHGNEYYNWYNVNAML